MSQRQRRFSEGPAGEPGLVQTPVPASAGAASAGREGPARDSASSGASAVQSRLMCSHPQELEKKFQQTAAYRNMKEILTKKNEQIKELRKQLQRWPHLRRLRRQRRRSLTEESYLRFRYEPNEWAGAKDGRTIGREDYANANGGWPSHMLLFSSSGLTHSRRLTSLHVLCKYCHAPVRRGLVHLFGWHVSPKPRGPIHRVWCFAT